MSAEILARIQFAFTISFHYIYPPLSIGLGVALVLMEGLWLKTGKPIFHNMARFWTRIFALTFAIGVATGIVMEFEFGTNWATYSRFVGDIFGSALAAEGIFAFFLESGFLAILLFGWNKVGPKLHFFATCMVCLGAHFSALWIVIANSWMQTPAGYHLETKVNGQVVQLPPDHPVSPHDLSSVRAVIDDFWAMTFNPSTLDRITHVLLGAWLAGAFLVISISSFYLLKKRHKKFAEASLKIGLVFATVAAFLQIVSGDFTARGVARNQPVKFAAIEGLFETQSAAPMNLLGWVDMKSEQDYGIKIPGLLSLLTHHAVSEPVAGLKQLPSDEFLRKYHPSLSSQEIEKIRRQYWPKVPAVFQLYHIMVFVGTGLMALCLIACWFWWKKWLFDISLPATRILLVLLVLSVLGPQIANQVGWFTAEMGRQPWIVTGLLRTSDALSKKVLAEEILISLILFALVYALLFAAFIFMLTRKISHGPDEEEESPEMPDSWKAVIRRD